MIIENLGTWSARPRRTHRPEVIIGRNANNLIVAKPRILLPDRRGFVVGVVNRHQQLVFVQPVFLGQQIPRVSNRFFFEVIAKAEIAHHLEECVMARCITNVVQIIVLAAGPHTFLAGHRAVIIPLLKPSENVLELHHARIGKHQRRVITRNQRRAFHHRMAIRLETIKKSAANIIQTGHDHVPLFYVKKGVSRGRATVHRVHTKTGRSLVESGPGKSLLFTN